MASENRRWLKDNLEFINSGWGIMALLGLSLMIGAFLAFITVLSPNPILALAWPILAIGAYISITRIEWALLILVFMVYTNFSDVMIKWHGAPSVAKLFVPMLLVVVLARWLLLNQPPRGWWRPVPFLLVWVGIGFAGLLYATDAGETQDLVVDLIKNILIAITVILLLNRGDTLRKAIWALLFAGIFLGTISVVQYLTGNFTNSYWGFGQAEVRQIIGETSDFRISGPIGDANTYGQIMLVMIPIGLDRFSHERNLLLRLLGGWAFAVCTLTVIFTFSRGAFLGLVVMGVFMVLTYARRPSYILTGLLVATVLVRFVPPEYTARISTIVDIIPGVGEEQISERAVRGRASEAQAAWLMFRDRPFFGVGLGNYNTHYLEYSSTIGLDNRRADRSAHSLYLETMAEQGIFGLFALLSILGAMLYYVYWGQNELSASARYDLAAMVQAFGIGVIGYLTAATFLHDAYPRFFWLLFGICFALPEVVKYESRYYEQE